MQTPLTALSWTLFLSSTNLLEPAVWWHFFQHAKSHYLLLVLNTSIWQKGLKTQQKSPFLSVLHQLAVIWPLSLHRQSLLADLKVKFSCTLSLALNVIPLKSGGWSICQWWVSLKILSWGLTEKLNCSVTHPNYCCSSGNTELLPPPRAAGAGTEIETDTPLQWTNSSP